MIMLAILAAPIIGDDIGEVFNTSPTVFAVRLVWELLTGD